MAGRDGDWLACIDTGGTFTDCLVLGDDGERRRIKVLSSAALRGRVTGIDPERRRLTVEVPWSAPGELVRDLEFALIGEPGSARSVVGWDGEHLELDGALPGEPDAGAPFELRSGEPAPLLAARLVLGPALPPLTMRLATTRGTNALLTGAGTPPVLFVTRGFADLLTIGTQARPALFSLPVDGAEPLPAAVEEVGGRLDARGAEVEPLDLAALTDRAEARLDQGHTVAAVALLHADKDPSHEREVAQRLRALGYEHVSASSELAPFIRILPRAETATADAYLSPVIGAYLAQIEGAIAGGRLLVMTSAGGLEPAARFRAKDCLLSGPAGGIAGAALAGRRAGHERLITFDMGGTSTDVARHAGDFEYVFEHTVGGAHLVAPALAIETVAAGGGSVCGFDGHRLTVGPESAGADPGPACYGAGGPLTLTDVNLLLGRIDPDRFAIPVEIEAAEAALSAVRVELAAAGSATGREELLEGLLDLANQRMAGAIRRISVGRGYDPRDHALVAFGGAGPQHALGVAERLGVKNVVVPPHPALLSARGLSAAVEERFAERQVLRPLRAVEGELAALRDELGAEARDTLARDGVDPDGVALRRCIATVRFEGQDAGLDVDWAPPQPLREAFESRYRKVFGHLPAGREAELISLRVVASTHSPEREPDDGDEQTHRPSADGAARTWVSGRWQEIRVYERDRLTPGAVLDGPCLVAERYSITVIEPGWTARVAPDLALIARQHTAAEGARRTHHGAVERELFAHRLEAVAREMGEALRRTAVSTNIKERLDFSCGVLDPGGELVVNAPHIPVHLGSLGLCVRDVVRVLPLGPGETAVTNHPAFGGSHLPDVTLISPAHADDGTLLGYVASRAHHAEIGGVLPGSMPPTATSLVEEGVVIAPRLLARHDRVFLDEVRALLADAPYPSRAIEDNVADLRAALAANHRGVTALQRLAATHGSLAVIRHMQGLTDRAEAQIQLALMLRDDGRQFVEEILDDGTPLRVAIEIDGGRARFDFGGTAGVHAGNLNATPAIVRSVVLYVLRLLIDEELPLNEGLLRAVDLHVPPGILAPSFPEDPAEAPAVVGGNVETSQRLANAMIRALGLAASSQGTMNNVLFGDEARSYYETVGGGCGAGPGFDGGSACHSHMTNTRITDAELVEHRYPVRVERFAVRHGSGGHGRFRGGDGLIRELRFLEPLTLSVLTQHRTAGPAGLAGGDAGLPGKQTVIRSGGGEERLEAIDTREMAPGDRLVLETPGGGGYGAPDA